MARNGKVARLPKWLRDRLNERLQDGESGVTLVAWLKELWDKNADIADAVGPDPINEQNLSVWRQGEYRDWERRQSATDLVRDLAEHAQDLKSEAGGREVSDRLSVALMGELARLAEALLAETTGTRERWEVLKDVLRELTRVRLADHRAAKLAREQADRQARKPRPVEPDPMTELRQQMVETRMAANYAGSLHMKGGRSEGNWEMAVAEAELEHGLPPGTLNAGQASRLPSPEPGEGSEPSVNEGESSKIKVNQGKAELEAKAATANEDEKKAAADEAESSNIKENQADGAEGGVPPSLGISHAGATSEEQTAAPPASGCEPGMGQQYAEDGTPLPPGVRWKLICNPYFSGPPSRMILVNAAGEEVTQDGQPIPAAGEAESSEIKENQGWAEAPPELPPAVYSTIPESPAEGAPTHTEEAPEEWEDGGWMKKRPRRGG